MGTLTTDSNCTGLYMLKTAYNKLVMFPEDSRKSPWVAVVNVIMNHKGETVKLEVMEGQSAVDLLGDQSDREVQRRFV